MGLLEAWIVRIIFKKMNFWTQLMNSKIFITNIALDAPTVRMSFLLLLSMGKSIENNQKNNAHAT